MKSNETIKAASIARVFDKAGNFILWLVKSNSDLTTTYHVRCKKIGTRCFWLCDCYAGTHGHYNGFSNKRCAHVRAIVETGVAKRETRKQAQVRANIVQFFADFATFTEQQQAVAEAARIVEEQRRKALPLNGNRGFSFMR